MNIYLTNKHARGIRWALVITLLTVFAAALSPLATQAQQKPVIISYYSGSLDGLDQIDPMQMTHIIYCFGRLKGNQFHLRSMRDTLLIQKMVSLKKRNPKLKVLLSLGGWGGCKTCSDVFNTATGRKEFAQSVKQTNDFFQTDGLDLDWESRSLPGHPGHPYQAADKENFTSLVQQLRKSLGKKHSITFAAGGFQRFVDEAVDWKKVMKTVDYVNLMTYDLVHGYSTVTGHHTPLYSTPEQLESTDNCVQALIKKEVDPKKMIIGAAFYARVWENVEDVNNGLYQPGKFKFAINYRSFDRRLTGNNGYEFFWDDTAQAPYAYNKAEKLFATFDNKRSVKLKADYVKDQRLGGIMYWELSLDTPDGLLQTIHDTLWGESQ